MPNASISPAAGVGTVLGIFGLNNIPRSLYLYENVGVEPLAIAARDLYLYENVGVEVLSVLNRDLYLYENLGIEALTPLARALYLYEAIRDGEVFPWLMKIDPGEQFRGGQVNLYGDGFGELLEAAAGATITTSTVSGGNVGTNAVDRLTAEWISTSGAAAWIRFTFGASKTIVGIALEDLGAGVDRWGTPLFRFSDAGGDVIGGSAVGLPSASTEYPVGAARTFYALPAPRTVTWVEVAISSGGSGTNRGLREAWIWEDLDAAAEGASIISNLGLGSEVPFGIAAWTNRSPGLWPANGGLPITPAATVTVVATAESGLVIVRESI